MQSCGRVTASKASHSISSEINPQGGKTEPRSDRRYREEKEGLSTTHRQPLGDLAVPVRLSLEERNTLIFRGALR